MELSLSKLTLGAPSQALCDKDGMVQRE